MRKLHILAIDDSVSQLACQRKILGQAGHTVKTTTEPDEAAKLLGADAFDLVIVDFHMPGHNGDEVLEKLKSSPIVGTPRFYIYTTDATVGSLDQVMGFDGALLAKGNADLLVTQVAALSDEIAPQPTTGD